MGWLNYVSARRSKLYLRGVAFQFHQSSMMDKCFFPWKDQFLEIRRMAEFEELIRSSEELSRGWEGGELQHVQLIHLVQSILVPWQGFVSTARRHCGVPHRQTTRENLLHVISCWPHVLSNSLPQGWPRLAYWHAACGGAQDSHSEQTDHAAVLWIPPGGTGWHPQLWQALPAVPCGRLCKDRGV